MRKRGFDLESYPPKPRPFASEGFLKLYDRNKPNTMVPWSGLHTAHLSAQYVAINNIPGDIVECGVWRGGCSVLMAETFAAMNSADRDFFLFDTFSGMPEPTSEDKQATSGIPAAIKFKRLFDAGKKWDAASLAQVESTVSNANYPRSRFHLVEGLVEETIPAEAPENIALLRLDTDWYESTRHEMEHLFPRLSPGGVLIIDDYGVWAGARQAVDEYIESNRIQILLTQDALNRAAIGIKQP